MTTWRRIAAGLVCAALAGCAQAPSLGDITTGSILPSLPSASSILPSQAALMPSLSANSLAKGPQRISGNLYRIDATDRRLDDPVHRENYALLRAAESTKQLGASHFIVVNAPPGDVRLSTSGQASGMIRIFNVEPGAAPPTGAIAADEMIHFFGPGFDRAPAAPNSAPLPQVQNWPPAAGAATATR